MKIRSHISNPSYPLNVHLAIKSLYIPTKIRTQVQFLENILIRRDNYEP